MANTEAGKPLSVVETEEAEASVLDRILALSPRTPQQGQEKEALDRSAELIEILLKRSVEEEPVTFDRNVTSTIEAAIRGIDRQISELLNAVMHEDEFLQLEGSWRGLHYLIGKTHLSPTLQIKVAHVTKEDLSEDLEMNQQDTWLFRELHQKSYNTAGGKPYGALIGDYQWGPGHEDVDILSKIAGISKLCFSPFITSASPQLLGLKSWTDLGKMSGETVANLTSSEAKYDSWRSFRRTEAAGFVALTAPRMLARVPYGQDSKAVPEFHYEEAPLDEKGVQMGLEHDDYCWMNSAYALGTRLTEAFDNYNFCTRIRGAESGGKVSDLPLFTHKTPQGDLANQCPVEVNLPDNIEVALGSHGLMPLVHYKDTNHAVFFGAQTAQVPAVYDNSPDATANAAIAARLPYVMASSRFAHYLKAMGRELVGSFNEEQDIQFKLEQWIKGYVNMNVEAKEELKAKYPLREAKVTVRPVPGKPGSYESTLYLRPWIGMEELTASMRMVATIPAAGNR